MQCKNKPYYTWIDLAKVIGIFLVIYGHGNLANQHIKEFIYTFHMPLFFVLSGLLYHPITFRQTLKKDWHTLITPYLLLNLLCLIPFLLSPLKGTFTVERLFQRVGAIVMGLGYEHSYWVPVSTPCWFLVSLFLARIILSFGCNYFNNKFLIFIGAISVLITWILHLLELDLLVPLDSTLLAMPFLCIGYKLKPFLLKEDYISRRGYFILTILILPLMCIISYFNGMVDTNKCLYGNFLVLYYLGGILGTLCVCFLSKCCNLQRRVLYCHQIAGGTLLIIGLNLWMIILVKKVFNIIFPSLETSGIIGFIIALICLIAFYPLIKITKHLFPAILGNRK